MVEQTANQQMEEVLNVTGDDPLSDAATNQLGVFKGEPKEDLRKITKETDMLLDVAGKDGFIHEPDQKLDYKDTMGLLFPITPQDPIFEDIKTMFEKGEYGSGVLMATLTALAMIPGFGTLPKATAKKIARDTAESIKKNNSASTTDATESALSRVEKETGLRYGHVQRQQLSDSEKPITSLNTYELPNEYFDPQTNEVIFSFDEGINTREYLFPNSRMYTSEIEKQIDKLPNTVDTGYFKKFVNSIPSDQARNLGLVNLLNQATKKGDKKITKEDITKRVNNNRFILTDTIYKFDIPATIESMPFGLNSFSSKTGLDKSEAVVGEPQFLAFSETRKDSENIASIMGARTTAVSSPSSAISSPTRNRVPDKYFRPYIDERFYKEILVGTPLAQKARPLTKEEIDQGFYIDVMGKTKPVTEAMKNMREPMVPMVTRKDFKNYDHYGKETDIDVTPIVHIRLYNNVIKSADETNPDSTVRRTIVSEIQSDISGGGKIVKDEVNPDTGISKKVEKAYGITEEAIALDRRLKSEDLKRDKLLSKIKGSVGLKRGDLTEKEYEDLLIKRAYSKDRLQNNKKIAFPLKTLIGIPETKRTKGFPQIVPDIPVVGRKGKIPQASTLGVKRAMKEAIENDSDEILFATDLVQSIRYKNGIGEGTKDYYARVLPQTIEKIGKENNINLNLRKENVQLNQFILSNEGIKRPSTLFNIGEEIAEYEKAISKGDEKFPWLGTEGTINLTKIMKTVGRLSKELKNEYITYHKILSEAGVGSKQYRDKIEKQLLEQSNKMDNLQTLLIDAINLYGENHPFVFNMQYWVIDVTPELRKLFKQGEVSNAIDFNKGGIVQNKIDTQMNSLFGQEQIEQ